MATGNCTGQRQQHANLRQMNWRTCNEIHRDGTVHLVVTWFLSHVWSVYYLSNSRKTLHMAFGFKLQCNTVHNHERRKGSWLKYFRRIVGGEFREPMLWFRLICCDILYGALFIHVRLEFMSINIKIKIGGCFTHLWIIGSASPWSSSSFTNSSSKLISWSSLSKVCLLRKTSAALYSLLSTYHYLWVFAIALNMSCK